MIPVQTQATEVDNLVGMDGEDEVQFTIGNVGLVMRSLSKLYSNPVLAAIREYSTNARDAHIESGNRQTPIKVTLPTLMHPFFEVEDFGVGMSKETLKETYTKFGDSTKRETNEQNGMLGYGCKSALAYADSFIVISRKDGVETQAMIVRKPDWSISLRVTSQSKTEKPNGTKVQIPARDFAAFKQIAMDFYRFWEPGTVEVDGVQPEWAVGEKLDDNLYYSKTPGTSYIVMGNVAYRIANPDALFANRNMRSISFVAYVPNGSCEFTPSREDLEYTDTTKKTLHAVIDNFEKKMTAAAKADIAGAKDYFDAYSKWSYWVGKLGKGPFGELEWGGEKFMDSIVFPAFRYATREVRYNMYQVKEWQVSQMSTSVIVTGMPGGNPGSHHKSRAKQYFREKLNISPFYILFTTQEEVPCVWIDRNRVVDWDTIREATKPPKKPKDPNAIVHRRVKGSFDYYVSTTENGNHNVWWKTEKEIPDDVKNLYYITVADEKLYSVSEAMRIFKEEAIIVVLPINRLNKFKRENPQAIEWFTHFKAKVNLNGVDFLDDKTKEALAIGHQTRAWIKALDLDKVADPEFKRLNTLIEEHTNTALHNYNQAYALARAFGLAYNFKGHNIQADNDSLIKRYPLLFKHNARYHGMGATDKSEFTFYINAKYAAAQAESKKGN